eukprot:COSAG01_NODE_23429_length_815_cov_6.272346_1_plen_80_part_00
MVRLRPGRIRDERAFQEMSARFGKRARVPGFLFDESVTAVTAVLVFKITMGGYRFPRHPRRAQSAADSSTATSSPTRRK